jgi:Ca2+-binding EF-hand superfamily protein
LKGDVETTEITMEVATSIAKRWMNVADTDGSGTLDFAEFSEFIGKFTPESSQEDLK